MSITEYRIQNIIESITHIGILLIILILNFFLAKMKNCPKILLSLQMRHGRENMQQKP